MGFRVDVPAPRWVASTGTSNAGSTARGWPPWTRAPYLRGRGGVGQVHPFIALELFFKFFTPGRILRTLRTVSTLLTTRRVRACVRACVRCGVVWGSLSGGAAGTTSIDTATGRCPSATPSHPRRTARWGWWQKAAFRFNPCGLKGVMVRL